MLEVEVKLLREQLIKVNVYSIPCALHIRHVDMLSMSTRSVKNTSIQERYKPVKNNKNLLQPLALDCFNTPYHTKPTDQATERNADHKLRRSVCSSTSPSLSPTQTYIQPHLNPTLR